MNTTTLSDLSAPKYVLAQLKKWANWRRRQNEEANATAAWKLLAQYGRSMRMGMPIENGLWQRICGKISLMDNGYSCVSRDLQAYRLNLDKWIADLRVMSYLHERMRRLGFEDPLAEYLAHRLFDEVDQAQCVLAIVEFEFIPHAHRTRWLHARQEELMQMKLIFAEHIKTFAILAPLARRMIAAINDEQMLHQPYLQATQECALALSHVE